MKKYLVEFMNMNEYELCLTKLIEAEESEIMEKVKDFHVDAINSYVKDQLEEKGIDPWISDEDLDAKVRDCLEVMPQGFDFYPYQRDINFGNALEENTCYAPDGSTRYIELTDEQAKKLESLKVEGDQQLQSTGIYVDYDSEKDNWNGALIYMLPELGWTPQEVVDKLKSLEHPFEDYELEDYLENFE